MKIPSQFNEDSLYNRPKPRGETVQDYRRLIRLGMGLALVLVVMRQAASPRLYEPFFGAVPNQGRVVQDQVPVDATRPDRRTAANRSGDGGPGDERPGEAKMAVPASAISAADVSAATDEVAPEMLSDASVIAAIIPESEQQLWLASLLRIRRQQAIPQFTVLETGWTVPLADLRLPETEGSEQGAEGNRSSQRLQAWRALIEQIASDPASFDSRGFDSRGEVQQQDWERMDALIAALDVAAAQRVAKSAVWQSKDRDALYRYLDQARDAGVEQRSAAAPPSVPQVGVLPLLQQPEVYLDKMVAFSGKVARVEKHAATSNEFEIVDYWHLWLRPLDGADRPLLAVVGEVPASIASLISATNLIDNGPPLLIQGRFLKRLAYRSGKGADLAPVIVGRVVMAPAAIDSGSTPGTTDLVAPEGVSSQVWTMVVIAVLIGVGLAGAVMWRTTVSAKRSRQIRNTKRKDPSDFLEQIGQSNGEHDAQSVRDESRENR
ncbi:hypothetical protein Pla52o_08370 [Novipirellula galeiformis]|uniref:Uncharacterized protein n=1 Tax=Novipirellula galeiformis TaxID=2528004 RepID=A0A5C6CUA8_9BACT|nr:hypothetical protein [Novipirellula galeiformis]TWU26981.1 hypothetical protein Pla52o_08370 [Novipirellula galeiformis]